jgi:hypothetical protein
MNLNQKSTERQKVLKKKRFFLGLLGRNLCSSLKPAKPGFPFLTSRAACLDPAEPSHSPLLRPVRSEPKAWKQVFHQLTIDRIHISILISFLIRLSDIILAAYAMNPLGYIRTPFACSFCHSPSRLPKLKPMSSPSDCAASDARTTT